MKFFAPITLFLALATARPASKVQLGPVSGVLPGPSVTESAEPQPMQTVIFEVESADQAINGSGITALHEGAGVNYIFLAQNSSMKLKYDPNIKALYQPINSTANLDLQFGIQEDVAVFGGGNASVTLQDWYLNFDGHEHFAACKNINDPYHFSESSYAVMHYEEDDVPETCIPFKLKVDQLFMIA